MKSFLSANLMFWRRFADPVSEDILLTEAPDHPVIKHSNAVAAKMVAQALGLSVAFVGKKIDFELLTSYSPNCQFISFKVVSFDKRLVLFLQAIYFYSKFFLSKNLLTFSYRGIPYGDFVYDGYLSRYAMATIHWKDVRLCLVFYRLLLRDYQARLLIEGNPVKALLVSHFIGLEFGPLSRVAMHKNIPVYWKSGGHGVMTLSKVNNLEERYSYPIRPQKQDIDLLIARYKNEVQADFKEFINHVDTPYHGAFAVGYKRTLISVMTRTKFLEVMGFEDKPLIFVMLHAFNDHPHSHFGRMLFADYFDWFKKTYDYALRDTSKNWIFKEHPANYIYQTNDVDLKTFFENSPSHIKFAAHDGDVTASTALNVADLVVTCLGTTGMEKPALRGIPSLIAGETSYGGLGFTLEPKTQTEYFSILKSFKFGKLSRAKQIRAQAAYIYFKKYVVMPFHAGPHITLEENIRPELLKNSYKDRVLEVYRNNRKVIYKEFNEYVEQIKQPNFRCLKQLPKSD